jgi:hypothetical protein
MVAWLLALSSAGPIQFYGPASEEVNITLQLEFGQAHRHPKAAL